MGVSPTFRRLAGAAASLMLFALALWLLRRALGHYHWPDVVARLSEIPASRVAVAVLLCNFSYLALGGFDWLGVRYVHRWLPLWKVVLISFISHAVSHNTGFAALTGGAVRYRMYTAAGLAPIEVAGVVAFCGVTFGLGAAALGGIALVAEPATLERVLLLPETALRVIGCVVLTVVAAYIGAGMWLRGTVVVAGRHLALPAATTAVAQIAVAAADLALAAAALHIMLPDGVGPSYAAFVGIYVLANLIGLVAHVPGGLGVFEGAMLLLTPQVPPDTMLGALLAFRVVYQLIPLAIAACLLAGYEVLARVGRLQAVSRAVGVWIDDMAPSVLAAVVFAAGSLLLLSGAVPNDPQWLAWAEAILPDSVVDWVHVVGSVSGAALLVLARGVNRRLRTAWHASLGLLVVGAVAALLGGRGAAVTLTMALVLAVTAPAGLLFRATAPLRLPRLTVPWGAAIVVVVMATFWLTLFAGRHAATHPEPLLARADVASAAFVLVYAVVQLAVGVRGGKGPPAA